MTLTERLLKSNPDINADNIPAIANLVDRINVYARSMQRHAIAACNRETTPTEEATDKANENAIYRLVDHLKSAGCKNIVRVTFDGDPRGALVKIQVSDRPGDWFGGDDFLCVLP